MSAKKRTVVIRGCIVKCDEKMARELEEKERQMSREDWRKNRVD